MLRTDVRFVDERGNLTQAGVQALTAEFGLRIVALETKISNAAAIANAAGGATVDAEARAQLAAIRAALT